MGTANAAVTFPLLAFQVNYLKSGVHPCEPVRTLPLRPQIGYSRDSIMIQIGVRKSFVLVTAIAFQALTALGRAEAMGLLPAHEHLGGAYH